MINSAIMKGGFGAVEADTYYLADGGYGDMNGLLITPYKKVRYHLGEWTRSQQRPVNARELFNLRHARARNVVERTFGIWKRRFTCLKKACEGHSIKTQVMLIYALAALHNFLNLNSTREELDEKWRR